MCLCASPHVALEAKKGLKFQAVMSIQVGVIQPRSSIGAVSAFNPLAISAIPVIAFDVNEQCPGQHGCMVMWTQSAQVSMGTW